MANIDAPSMKLTTLLPATVPMRNTRSGTKGDLLDRASRKQNASNSPTPTAIGTIGRAYDLIVMPQPGPLPKMPESVFETADNWTIPAKRQTVAHQRPEHRDHRHQHEALHHDGQHVFAAYQTAIKQGQAGPGHHQHQRRARQHSGIVAGALGGSGGGFERANLRLQIGGALCQGHGGQPTQEKQIALHWAQSPTWDENKSDYAPIVQRR